VAHFFDPGFGLKVSSKLFLAPSSLSKLRSTKAIECATVKPISNATVQRRSRGGY